MDIEKLKIAEEVVKTAEELVLADYEYIYDPDHKKHPGGGYIKTENGWSKGKEDEEEKGGSGKSESKTDEEKSTGNKDNSKQKVTKKHIEEKLKSFPPGKIHQMSKDGNAPSLLLDILSSNEDYKIRMNVADNKNTNTKTLDKLANDKDESVRMHVALNENTSPETLNKMSNDSDDGVRMSVAGNKNTPFDTVYKMCDDKDDNVRLEIANENTNPKILDKLANDKDEWIRRSVTMNENTSSETLGKLVEDKSDTVYHCVSNNKNADGEQLEYLYNRIMEGYEEDKKNSNKSTLHSAKYVSDNWSLENIANHKNTKSDTLDQIAQKFPEGDKIGDAARNNLKARGAYDPEYYGDNKPQKKQQQQAPAAPPPPPPPPPPPSNPPNSSKTPSETGESNKNKFTTKQLENGLKKLSPQALADIAKGEKTSGRVLDILSNHKDADVRQQVALNKNTSTETLDKMAESSSADDHSVISALVNNNKLSATGVFAIADKFDDSCPYSTNIVEHPSMSSKDVEELFDSTNSGDIQVAVCLSKKVSNKFLKDKIDNYYGDDDLYGKLCFDTFQEKNEPTKVKYKFKGDDKTAPIIRAKFEKGNDEEETDSIYGEMAKFSRDDVAPMGVYHGRTKDQLKADFIKNMNPANYSSPEAFQNAKKRIQALSANDFSRILASIFADEEEEV